MKPKRRTEPIDLGYGFNDELLPYGKFGIEAVGGPVITRTTPEKLRLDGLANLPSLASQKEA